MKQHPRARVHLASSPLRQLTPVGGSIAVALTLIAAACSGGRPSVTDGGDAHGGDGSSTLGGAGGDPSRTAGGAGGVTGIFTSGGSNSSTGSAGTSATTTLPPVCGDGTQAPTEACDDGNVVANDGCAADCTSVEDGYICPEPGKACVSSQVCGDKKISGTENCDDGNTTAGDGCSEKCRTESGWACPFVGARCIADQCGDGIVAGSETCDDANAKSGDGCSVNCTVESPTVTERNGWVCPTPGAACVRTTCNDSKREGTEQCDDGNNDMGDGCTPACRKEPSCPAAGGACKSVCGDGMILPTDTDQECDDGNSTDGDGCSSTCVVEPGYGCKNEPVSNTSLILPIVLRDFKAYNETNGHPDFQQYNEGFERGIVQAKLDAQGKPQHVLANKDNTDNAYTAGVLTSDEDYFAVWYRDNATYNKTVLQNLTFTRLTTGEFEYGNTSFFPLTGLGWGNYGTTNRNFHFTSEVRYWFEYRGGETLRFRGDDDVWVFVNKQLAVDLGGVHGVISGSVILDAANGSGLVCENANIGCANAKTVALGLEIGKVYEIVVFQAERHTNASNYTLTLSAFSSTRSTCTSVCGDAIVTPDEACDLGKDKNTGAYGTCTPECKLPPYCGDAKVDAADGEQCDDGVNRFAYGYNNTPACAPGCKWTHYCGDKIVDGLFGEQCDDGNQTSGDGCEANCLKRVGCGNGAKEEGEACDDGNTHSGDGCSQFCTIESILF